MAVRAASDRRCPAVAYSACVCQSRSERFGAARVLYSDRKLAEGLTGEIERLWMILCHCSAARKLTFRILYRMNFVSCQLFEVSVLSHLLHWDRPALHMPKVLGSNLS